MNPKIFHYSGTLVEILGISELIKLSHLCGQSSEVSSFCRFGSFQSLRLLLFAAISEFSPLILRRFWIPGFIWGAFKTRGLIERSSPVNSLHGFLRLILTQNELLISVPLLLIVFEPEEINIPVTKNCRMHELGEDKTSRSL